VIVCHCHVVNDRTVDDAVAAGARTVSAICRTTGAGRSCGSCVFSLKRLLSEHVVESTDVLEEVDGAAG
jgi:bacterioferritin-associated ferredoxin